MDELEWRREDHKLSPEQRNQAVDELIGIVVDVDSILQAQSAADLEYFLEVCDRTFTTDEIARLKSGVLKAYRWQYIFSGVEHPRFKKLIETLTTDEQLRRIQTALAPLA